MSHLHQRRKADGGGDELFHTETPKRGQPDLRRGVAFGAAVAAALGVLLIVLYLRFPPAKTSSGVRLFTPSELQRYDGSRSKLIYLAVMGSVYDVTPGKRHYGKDGGYSFFAGKDASRSYVTGQFQSDLHDDVADFDSEQFQELVRWRDFYETHKAYSFVGHMVGRFYDADGRPTPLLHRAEEMARQERETQAQRKQQQQRGQQMGGQGGSTGEVHTPCNVRWTKREGGSVWCATGHFPRQVAGPAVDGQVSTRCACFAEDTVDASRRLYPGCQQRAESCQTSPPEGS